MENLIIALIGAVTGSGVSSIKMFTDDVLAVLAKYGIDI